jgi:radical SAM superfamily enzyme YgiQ (UPF0313 family)
MGSLDRRKKILLVNPEAPASYWGLQGAAWFLGAKAAYAPLPLLTLAALLPDDWEIKLIDMNVQRLRLRQLLWADEVWLTAMIAQKESLTAVLARCARLGIPTRVGGPFASASPDAKELSQASSLFIGEAESGIINQLIEDTRDGTCRKIYRSAERPSLHHSPVPRYDLLKNRHYCAMSIQVSRGCPHKCEFCSVRMLFGHRPRYKTPQQIVAELQAIYDTGYRGNVFFVDDNFIGKPRLAEEVLRAIIEWQRIHGRPFLFFTESDIRIAERDDLVQLMVEAGFFAVFIGFESPSEEALTAADKKQNLKIDAHQAVRHLRQQGLLVYGGFIVGFDSDGPDCARLTYEFIAACGIDFAMAGLLIAIPDTPLESRLRNEGRLLNNEAAGDQFGLSNILPKSMTRLELLKGYRQLLEKLYEPRLYFERAQTALTEWRAGAGRRAPLREWWAVACSVVRQGIFSRYSWHYWRFMLRTLFQEPRKIARAFAIAISGHHFFTYTRRVVLPRLRHEEQMLAEECGN